MMAKLEVVWQVREQLQLLQLGLFDGQFCADGLMFQLSLSHTMTEAW